MSDLMTIVEALRDEVRDLRDEVRVLARCAKAFNSTPETLDDAVRIAAEKAGVALDRSPVSEEVDVTSFSEEPGSQKLYVRRDEGGCGMSEQGWPPPSCGGTRRRATPGTEAEEEQLKAVGPHKVFYVDDDDTEAFQETLNGIANLCASYLKAGSEEIELQARYGLTILRAAQDLWSRRLWRCACGWSGPNHELIGPPTVNTCPRCLEHGRLKLTYLGFVEGGAS